MNFVSLSFVLFLLALTVLYYLVPKKVQWPILLAANILFYVSGGVKSLLFLAFTTLSAYSASLGLDSVNKKVKEAKAAGGDTKKLKKHKKYIVAAACAANFLVLFLVKYLESMIGTLSSVFSADISAPSIIMPLGISFYIFSSVGYVIDVYRGKTAAEKNPFKVLLFTSFFPTVVQGPISRFSALSSQLTSPHPCSAENIKSGIERIMWGYFKKMVIADRAAVVVTAFFSDYTTHGGAVGIFAILMYSINLYCDFSGGIDISIGAARLLGITLDENFMRPIFAKSLTEYWRRWHITLGSWMRDYVFYPLSLSAPFGKLGRWSREKIGGKLGKILPTSAATFIIYFLIGIWHGSSFKYIAFGFYNGIIITSSLLLANFYDKAKTRLKINSSGVLYSVFATVRTSLIVFVGRYITRSPRFLVSLSLIAKIFTDLRLGELNSAVMSFGLTTVDYAVIAFSLVILLAYELYEEKRGSVFAMLDKKKPIVQWLVMLGFMLILLCFGIMRGEYISSEFIYKQF